MWAFWGVGGTHAVMQDMPAGASGDCHHQLQHLTGERAMRHPVAPPPPPPHAPAEPALPAVVTPLRMPPPASCQPASTHPAATPTPACGTNPQPHTTTAASTLIDAQHPAHMRHAAAAARQTPRRTRQRQPCRRLRRRHLVSRRERHCQRASIQLQHSEQCATRLRWRHCCHAAPAPAAAALLLLLLGVSERLQGTCGMKSAVWERCGSGVRAPAWRAGIAC